MKTEPASSHQHGFHGSETSNAGYKRSEKGRIFPNKKKLSSQSIRARPPRRANSCWNEKEDPVFSLIRGEKKKQSEGRDDGRWSEERKGRKIYLQPKITSHSRAERGWNKPTLDSDQSQVIVKILNRALWPTASAVLMNKLPSANRKTQKVSSLRGKMWPSNRGCSRGYLLGAVQLHRAGGLWWAFVLPQAQLAPGVW